MANRYWIGTGSWFSTSNWSTSSGGAGGASVPGEDDDVIFDSNGTGACNIDEDELIVINSLTKNNSANIFIDEAFVASVLAPDTSNITINENLTLQGTGSFEVSDTISALKIIVKGDFLDENTNDVSMGNTTFEILGDCTLSANYSHTNGSNSLGSINLYGLSNTFSYSNGTALHILSIEGIYTCTSNVPISFSNTGTGSSKSRVQINGTFNWVSGRASVSLYALHINGTLISDIGIILISNELRKYGTFETTDATSFYFYGGSGAKVYPGDYSDMNITFGSLNSSGEAVAFAFEADSEYSFGTFNTFGDTYAYQVDFNGSTFNLDFFNLGSTDENVNIIFNNCTFNVSPNDEQSIHQFYGNLSFEDMETANFNLLSGVVTPIYHILFLNIDSGENEIGKVTVNNCNLFILSATWLDSLDIEEVISVNEDNGIVIYGYDTVNINNTLDIDGIIQFQDGSGNPDTYVNTVNVTGDFKCGSTASTTFMNMATTLTLNVTGNSLVKYTTVANIDASGGEKIHTLYCTDNGNNLNWDFNQNLELINPENTAIQYLCEAVKGGILTREKGLPLRIRITGYAPESELTIYGRESSGEFEVLQQLALEDVTELVYNWHCLKQGIKYFWYITLETPTETITSDVEEFTVDSPERNMKFNLSCQGISHRVRARSLLVNPNYSRVSSTGAAVVPAITILNLN